jgi:hypothetical protein
MNGLSFPGTAKRRPLSANMGGPMSRTRKERVSSTLLGRDGGPIRCPRVIRLGLDFDGKAPVETLGRILAEEGYGSQEGLREDFPMPERRLVCRLLPEGAERLPVATGRRAEVLRQALMLGLCTAQYFDPLRPVLWTEASLARGLELFDPAGFYA